MQSCVVKSVGRLLWCLIMKIQKENIGVQCLNDDKMLNSGSCLEFRFFLFLLLVVVDDPLSNVCAA